MREKLRDIQFWLFIIWFGALLSSCQTHERQDDIIKELREIKQELRNDNAQ